MKLDMFTRHSNRPTPPQQHREGVFDEWIHIDSGVTRALGSLVVGDAWLCSTLTPHRVVLGRRIDGVSMRSAGCIRPAR